MPRHAARLPVPSSSWRDERGAWSGPLPTAQQCHTQEGAVQSPRLVWRERGAEIYYQVGMRGMRGCREQTGSTKNLGWEKQEQWCWIATATGELWKDGQPCGQDIVQQRVTARNTRCLCTAKTKPTHLKLVIGQSEQYFTGLRGLLSKYFGVISW